MENLIKELNKVTDEKRLNFLHFTFIRMINSTIVIHDALKGGRVELTRIGKVTKSYLELGLQKVRDVKQYTETESVFVDFDFFDLYRIGKSLIEIEKNKIKKSLRKTPFENDDYEYFLGAWWTSFLEYADSEIPKMKSFGAGLHAQKISSLSTYQNWTTEVDLFRNSIPFINSFFEMFLNLKKEGKLHDSFYLNYEVENIDFEAILISSFINFSLGHFSGSDVNKMGVTISELKQFFNKFFTKNDEEYILLPLTTDFVLKTVDEFIKKFGFKTIPAFEKYLYGVLSEHLSGYEFDTLDDEDFKHIGGPILLNFTKN